MTKYIIEVHHDGSVKHYNCESFTEAAKYDGWTFETINTIEDIEKIYGDDVPQNIQANSSNLPIVHEYDDGYLDNIYPASQWDAENAAREYLGHDLSQMIVIESKADAEFYATKYNNHAYIAVRRVAHDILTNHFSN